MKTGGLICLTLLLAGCTTVYQPNRPPQTTLDLPLFGSQSINAPPVQPGVPDLRWDGAYAGDAALITPHSPAPCDFGARITDLRVSGGHVQYGRFNGVIGPNATVSMVDGPATFSGQFREGQFIGALQRQSCVYSVRLNRVTQG